MTTPVEDLIKKKLDIIKVGHLVEWDPLAKKNWNDTKSFESLKQRTLNWFPARVTKLVGALAFLNNGESISIFWIRRRWNGLQRAVRKAKA